MITVTAPTRSHILKVVRALTRAGWIIRRAPTKGRLAPNGQLVTLRAGNKEARLRLFVYKVTSSSRGRSSERRIEITSTYQKGLRRRRDVRDVVMGWDEESGTFVGVDPRRLAEGGATGNASSFFDLEGLSGANQRQVLVRPRYARLFPDHVEFHAFFKPNRLADYLLNVDSVHSNALSAGLTSIATHPRKGVGSLVIGELVAEGAILELAADLVKAATKASRKVTEAFLGGDFGSLRARRLSPEDLEAIQKQAVENGQLGEKLVLDRERRRLRSAGRSDLARRVKWTSQETVLAGYDIRSFAADGSDRWIEVKSTSGTGSTFPMSDNEWRTAKRLGEAYHVYRVTGVRSRSPVIKEFGNFAALEDQGLITRRPFGWLITLK